MRQLRPSIQKVIVARSKFGLHILCVACLYCQHRVSADCVRGLEQKDLAAYIFNNAVSSLNRCDKGGLLSLGPLGIHKVVVEVVQHIQNQIIAL